MLLCRCVFLLLACITASVFSTLFLQEPVFPHALFLVPPSLSLSFHSRPAGGVGVPAHIYRGRHSSSSGGSSNGSKVRSILTRPYVILRVSFQQPTPRSHFYNALIYCFSRPPQKMTMPCQKMQAFSISKSAFAGQLGSGVPIKGETKTMEETDTRAGPHLLN